jgi:phage recombination protein Bet
MTRARVWDDEGRLTDDGLRLLRAELQPKDRQPTSEEVELFAYHVERTQLDPFANQIYGVFRWNARVRGEAMTVQAGIDGFRLVAERTGKYLGQTAQLWCGQDGDWRDVWLSDGYPAASRVGVRRERADEPTPGVAHWKEYAPINKSGKLAPHWQRMPALMLAKCAEALALRRAFPAELSGIYTAEEMAQADVDTPEIRATGTTVEPAMMPTPKPTAVPASSVTPTGNGAAGDERPATSQEITALRALMDATETPPSYVRMALVVTGRDEVGEFDDLLESLTAKEVIHVMQEINRKAGGGHA